MLWLLLACTPKTTPASDTAPALSGWVSGASLDDPLQENATVALDGEVWVLGGFSGLESVDQVLAYDPDADAWREAAPMPEPMHHVNAVAHEGRIFVLGVLEGLGFEEQAATWIYDPAADAWTTGAPMPSPRGSSGIGSLGERIVVAGGLAQGEAVATTSAYLPAEDRWEALPDMPTARDHAGFGVVDGALIVAGGRTVSIESVLDAVESFDPETNTWRALSPLPTARGGVSAEAWDGQLYIIGGEGDLDDERGVFDEVERYDPAADTWASLDPMANPRHGTGAAAVDGVIWVPGGADKAGFGAVDVNEGFVAP